jgi:hypothetical protein
MMNSSLASPPKILLLKSMPICFFIFFPYRRPSYLAIPFCENVAWNKNESVSAFCSCFMLKLIYTSFQITRSKLRKPSCTPQIIF